MSRSAADETHLRRVTIVMCIVSSVGVGFRAALLASSEVCSPVTVVLSGVPGWGDGVGSLAGVVFLSPYFAASREALQKAGFGILICYCFVVVVLSIYPISFSAFERLSLGFFAAMALFFGGSALKNCSS